MSTHVPCNCLGSVNLRRPPIWDVKHTKAKNRIWTDLGSGNGSNPISKRRHQTSTKFSTPYSSGVSESLSFPEQSRSSSSSFFTSVSSFRTPSLPSSVYRRNDDDGVSSRPSSSSSSSSFTTAAPLPSTSTQASSWLRYSCLGGMNLRRPPLWDVKHLPRSTPPPPPLPLPPPPSIASRVREIGGALIQRFWPTTTDASVGGTAGGSYSERKSETLARVMENARIEEDEEEEEEMEEEEEEEEEENNVVDSPVRKASLIYSEKKCNRKRKSFLSETSDFFRADKESDSSSDSEVSVADSGFSSSSSSSWDEPANKKKKFHS